MSRDRTDDVLKLFQAHEGTMTIPLFRKLWEGQTGQMVSPQVAARRFRQMIDRGLIRNTGMKAAAGRGERPDIYVLANVRKPSPSVKTIQQVQKERKVRVGTRWRSRANPERVVKITKSLKLEGRPSVELDGKRYIFTETLQGSYDPCQEEDHAPD